MPTIKQAIDQLNTLAQTPQSQPKIVFVLSLIDIHCKYHKLINQNLKLWPNFVCARIKYNQLKNDKSSFLHSRTIMLTVCAYFFLDLLNKKPKKIIAILRSQLKSILDNAISKSQQKTHSNSITHLQEDKTTHQKSLKNVIFDAL